MAKIDGGPAFPLPVTEWNPGNAGMSLRDWFAGQALAGIMAGWPANERISEARAAEISYHAADAMIAERDAQRREGTW
jgi:hypothetical protein